MKRRVVRPLSWVFHLLGLVVASASLFAAEGVPSPYQGNMTAEEKAAAATITPPFREARWVHEAALMAYEAQLQLDDLDAQVATAKARAQGDEQTLQQIDQQAAQMRAQFERYTRNIPKLGGVYFRPAIEAAIETGNFSPDNAFAKLLTGGTLEGISLSDDQKAFAHSVAWRSVGGLAERKVQYVFRPWWLQERPEQIDLFLDAPSYRESFEQADSPTFFETMRTADLTRWTTLATPGTIISGTVAVESDAPTQPADNQFGAWHVSIELIRSAIDGAGPEQVELARQLADAAGLTAELGPMVQYPRLHFQARLDDVLMADTEVLVLIEQSDGTRRQLERAAQIELVLPGAPAMVTSYASQRVHASMVPSTADWALIRSSATRAFLLAVPMMREDGVPDYIILPMSLTGFGDALAQLEQAQQAGLKGLAALNARYDQALAAAQPRFAATAARLAAEERKRKEDLAALEGELRAFVNARRPNANLPVFPTDMPNRARSAEVKAFNERLSNAYATWDAWRENYRAVVADLYGFGARFWKLKVEQNAAAGGLLQQEIDRWEQVARNTREAITAFNSRVEAHNQVSFADTSSRRERNPERFRRRTADDEPSEAEKFFRDQQKPYVPYFRDTPPPPRPTHYIGTGYY